MSHLHLTLACEDYDRTRALKDGLIKPEGIELNYLVMSVEEIFWRMMKYEEFDVSELSMGAFLTAAARGRRPFVAIPVFPSRTFRHRCIFVNTTSGIQRVEDLRGKRMGVPEYSMTAAVWLRGLFQHEYGVPPSEIHWVQAGEEHPGRKDRFVSDYARDRNQTFHLRKRALGGADAVQSILRSQRDLHARSLRYQHTARELAVDIRGIRRHAGFDDRRLLAVRPGAQSCQF